MQLSSVANRMQETASSRGLASRYEALICLAAVIRSHPEEKDLFQTLAAELHNVVQFDGINQFDAVASWVQWSFVEPYQRAFEAPLLNPLPKEETLAWWVYRNQQPLVISFIDQETRFPQVVERLKKLGLRSLCALPLTPRPTRSQIIT